MMLALVCSLGFTACSDDNDEKKNDRVVVEGGKQYVPEDQLTAEESYLLDCQTVVISVIRNLTGIENVTPDVVETNHEPTYGVAFGSDNSLVRAVECESVDYAEQLFFSIIGLDKEKASCLVTATSDGYTVSIEDLPILKDEKKFTLGTLTFHRGDGTTNFGSIDVEIDCIPHLERIDFVGANAFPENAGAAYHTEMWYGFLATVATALATMSVWKKKRIGQVVEVTYKYVLDKEWDTFCKNNCVYTVNAIHFDDYEIPGVVLEFSAIDGLDE